MRDRFIRSRIFCLKILAFAIAIFSPIQAVDAETYTIPPYFRNRTLEDRERFVKTIERVLTDRGVLTDPAIELLRNNDDATWNAWWNSTFQSSEFASLEAQHWLRECGATVDTNRKVPQDWNWELHDRWIERSIAQNVPLNEFLIRQLDSKEESDQAAGAIWLRTGLIRKLAVQSVFPPIDPYEAVDLPPCLSLLSNGTKSMVQVQVDRSQATPLLQLENAMRSIRKIEVNDWRSILKSDEVEKWYGKLRAFPAPEDRFLEMRIPFEPADAEDKLSIVGNTLYSATLRGIARIQEDGGRNYLRFEGGSAVIEEGPILSRAREFTMIFDVKLDGPNATADLIAVTPNADSDRELLTRGLTIRLVDGRLKISMVHSSGTSAIEVISEDVLSNQRWLSLCVAYDGTSEASAFRVYVDGRPVALQVNQKDIWKDVGDGRPMRWQLGGVPNDSNVTHSSKWELDDFRLFKLSLTHAEIMETLGGDELKPWSELSEMELRMWQEHYARRVHLNWRYERESYLYYLENYTDKVEQLPMLPTLMEAGLPFERRIAETEFPLFLFADSVELKQAEQVRDRQAMAKLFRSIPAATLSKNLVRGSWSQWNDRLRRLDIKNDLTWVQSELDTLSESLVRSGWDRRHLTYEFFTSEKFFQSF